ncbi:MAG: hypothetical protein A3K10_05245 [Bacteroidetes bacterium RIFCSPLOWO2_12_FULL_31_6]|jgi:hypothetical protein|nr:MAG: hypothetical protein A3K10_05245 [Bacteroidetes bacterium RIFCSPLOWO2_12_FULL_31_6]
MNFKLSFKPDENYYNEAYSEIVSSLKFKKYQPLFATILVFFGITLYFLDTQKKLGLFSLAFSIRGVYEFYKIYYEKKKWLKDRLQSGIAGQTLEMDFNEETIKHCGPFSNGEINWNGIKDIIKTKKGLLLKPENGISIYLPNRLFKNNEQINFIISKKTARVSGLSQ